MKILECVPYMQKRLAVQKLQHDELTLNHHIPLEQLENRSLESDFAENICHTENMLILLKHM